MVSELRKLATPTKIITVAFTLLFVLTSFFAGHFFNRVSNNDSDLQVAVIKLNKEKVDVSAFEKQCDLNRAELDKKADKDKVDIVQKRLDQIIGIMLDPSKKDQIRAQINAEKRIKE